MLVYRPRLLAAAVAVAIASPMGILAQSAYSQSADPQNKISPIINNSVKSQPGAIVGVVVNTDTGRPVRAADIKADNFFARTNSKGEFKLELPSGNYELTIEHPEFRTVMVNALTVKPKQLTTIDNVQLQRMSDEEIASEVSSAIEEVIVTATYNPYSSIEAERMSTNVMDTIDFEQIARFDDSSVSAALARVVGVSLEEGRYPVVRGMRSRYQSAYFNDSILPGTDPARRDLPLDIFPANIMKSLSLQKSASADRPAWATAGHIDMATIDVPEEAFFKSSFSMTYWDGLEDDFIRAEGSRTDFLGIDDGRRDMPELLEESRTRSLTERERFQVAEDMFFPEITYGKGAPNTAISLAGGNSWEVTDKQSIGFIASTRFATNWQAFNRLESEPFCSSDTLDDGTPDPDAEQECGLAEFSEVQDHERIINLSSMFNIAWDINDEQRIGLENLLVRQTTDEVQHSLMVEFRGGDDPSQLLGDDIDTDLQGADLDNLILNDDNTVQERRNNWIEEQLINHRLFGEHQLWHDSELSWHLQTATATFDRPNFSFYRKAGERFDFSELFFYGFGWEEFETNTNSYKLDFSSKILDGLNFQLTTHFGVYGSSLEQDSQNVLLGIDRSQVDSAHPALNLPQFEAAIRGASDGFIPLRVHSLNDEEVSPTLNNNILLEQENSAYYLKTEANLWETVSITAGVRNESMTIAMDEYIATPEPLADILDEEYSLPSVSATWFIKDDWQIRLGYSETVSWPETFEVSPRQFTNRETNEQITGNPDLKPAEVTNADIRFEWYPGENESVTLAFFTKDITSAIETTIGTDSDKGTARNTYNNAPTVATVTGWELDLRQEFTFGKLDDHSVFLQFNYTDISSEVDEAINSSLFNPDNEVSYRNLQGQPDSIINLQLGYDHFDSGQQLTLAFNRRGEELARVDGTTARNHIFETEYDDLRLIYKKSFNSGFYSALSVNNLLDSERSLEERGLVYRRWKPGRSVKLKIGYDF